MNCLYITTFKLSDEERDQIKPIYPQLPHHKVLLKQLSPQSFEFHLLKYLFTEYRPTKTLAPLDPSGIQIIEIAKIFNNSVYDRFSAESKRQGLKHHGRLSNEQMFRLMFHGTRNSDPKLIYESEDGLDMRFSSGGFFGNGIYFAENAAYSHQYAFNMPHQGGIIKQMFVCCVCVGRYKSYDAMSPHTKQFKVPPLIDGQTTMRFDSVYSRIDKHSIIYDNAKAYPGYLITYSA